MLLLYGVVWVFMSECYFLGVVVQVLFGCYCCLGVAVWVLLLFSCCLGVVLAFYLGVVAWLLACQFLLFECCCLSVALVFLLFKCRCLRVIIVCVLFESCFWCCFGVFGWVLLFGFCVFGVV